MVKKVANNLSVAQAAATACSNASSRVGSSPALPANPGLSTDDRLFVVQLAQDAHDTSNPYGPG
jgi:hypothetical protein